MGGSGGKTLPVITPPTTTQYTQCYSNTCSTGNTAPTLKKYSSWQQKNMYLQRSTQEQKRGGRATTNCNDPFARSTQLAACARINIAKTHQQYHPHCHCHGYYISHIQCQYTLCFFLLSSLLYQLCESLVFIKTNLFVSRLLIQDPIIVPIGSNLMTSCTWLLNVENIHFPLKLKEVFAILGQNGFPKLNFSHF